MPEKSPTRQKEGSARTWGLKDIEELLDVLAGREITEFEMEQQGVKIRIKRGNAHAGNPGATENSLSPAFAPSYPPAAPNTSPVSSAAPLPSVVPQAGSLPVEPVESAEGLYIQKSPIVGTFYAAPSPNAPPFVKLSDVVQVGQVLCIIEAMKLMNELESEVAGEIVRIYVENGQPVEYGQSLFAIKPSHKK
jgi:acetyl-CoA carboxylase biotin carboxyl carrier protein